MYVPPTVVLPLTPANSKQIKTNWLSGGNFIGTFITTTSTTWVHAGLSAGTPPPQLTALNTGSSLHFWLFAWIGNETSGDTVSAVATITTTAQSGGTAAGSGNFVTTAYTITAPGAAPAALVTEDNVSTYNVSNMVPLILQGNYNGTTQGVTYYVDIAWLVGAGTGVLFADSFFMEEIAP